MSKLILYLTGWSMSKNGLHVAQMYSLLHTESYGCEMRRKSLLFPITLLALLISGHSEDEAWWLQAFPPSDLV